MISELIVSLLKMLPVLLFGLLVYRAGRVWFRSAPPLEGSENAEEE